MYARVGRYEVPPEKIEDDLRQAPKTFEEVERLPGLKGSFYFVDRKTGHTMSMTLWESEDAMMAAAEEAKRLREMTMAPTGGRITSVDEYEVVIMPDAIRRMDVRAA